METSIPPETETQDLRKGFTTIRFVVSGTPFDVPFAELKNFPSSTLYIAATTRIGEPKRDQDGVPIVVFARDVWAFRLLRHFIGCGELIVPANETERQLLLAEAGFYGLEAAAAIILESFGTPTTAAPVSVPTPAAYSTAIGSMAIEPRPGFSIPSRASRLRYQVNLPAAERIEPRADNTSETHWALPRQTFGKTFTDEDTAIRAQEYIARVAFAADSNTDATPHMPWVAKFFGGDGKAEETPRIIPQIGEGGKAEETAKTGEASSVAPFWLGAASTEKSDMYAKLACPGLPVTHDDTSLRFIANSTDFELNFRAFTLDTLGDILGGLPVVAAGGCVLAALCAWPRTVIPTAKLLAEYLDSSMAPCQALLATRRFNRNHRRRFARYDADAGEADPRHLRLQTLLERIRHLEDKLGLGRSAPEEPIEDAPPSSIVADDYALLERVAAMLRMDIALDESGAGLIWKKASADVAPAADNVCNLRFLRGFRAADIDLFLTTRDPDVAFETVLEVFRRLRRAVPPSCQIEILRSANSVTFLLPWPYRTIQVVSRLYHSAAQVLLGFDLDCCCVAYDGTSVLALPRALRALRRGYNLVDPSRQSLTYEGRLLKYARRGFVIAVPGDVDLQKNIAAVREKLRICITTGTYLELRGFQLLLAALLSRLVGKGERSRLTTVLGIRHSDYGHSNFRTPRTLDRHVRSLVRRDVRPPFALGADPVAVLLSAACVYTCWGRPQLVEGTVPAVIEFQTEAPHVQDRVDRLFTGAFNPSSADWF